MIRDAFIKTITASMTPAAIKTLINGIKLYVDKNSEILLSKDLSKRYSFGDNDRKLVYTAIGLTEEEITAQIKASKYINKTNRNNNNPFYAACMMAMHQLVKLKKPTEAMMVMTYMSLMMYTSIHKGFFEYGANKQIMDYTLANLDASYRILSVNSIFAFIQDNAEVTFNTYKKRIEKLDDQDITYVTDAAHTRIKGKIRKIANAYYENHKSGRYLNAESDIISDTEYREIDNNSMVMDRLANKVYLKLLNHQIDDRFLKYAITRSDVSYTKLKNVIDDIISDDEDNKVRSYILWNIEYFLLTSGKGPEYISRGEFITYMNSAYASNTALEQMVNIKTTLENWIIEHATRTGGSRYGKTAMVSYKKSVFMWFLFIINHEAKIN